MVEADTAKLPAEAFAITWYDNDGVKKLGELRVDGLHTKRERLVWQFSDGRVKVLVRRRWWKRALSAPSPETP